MYDIFVKENRKEKLVSEIKECLKFSILETYSDKIEIEWEKKFLGYYELIGRCDINKRNNVFLYAAVENNEIKKFFVSSSIRKRGIGRAAMNFLIDIFRSNGADNLFVIPDGYNHIPKDIAIEMNVYLEENEIKESDRIAFYKNIGFNKIEGSDPLMMNYDLHEEAN